MDFNIVLRLEEQVDRLLSQRRALVEEVGRLRSDCALLQSEQGRFRKELDRILGKLERLEREGP